MCIQGGKSLAKKTWHAACTPPSESVSVSVSTAYCTEALSLSRVDCDKIGGSTGSLCSLVCYYCDLRLECGHPSRFQPG
jgi:hypothetical protein